MKNIVICFKISKIYFFILALVIILVIFLLGRLSFEDIKHLEKTNIEIIENNMQGERQEIIDNNEDNTIRQEEIIEDNENTVIEQKEEYKTMPREIEGYKVVGKIQIPKINLESYILSETNSKTLNISLTKLCGLEINEVGNFCIAGHNYNSKMFSQIKKLEIKDSIILTDTYDNSTTYEVYDNFQVSPKDVSCLSQDTGGDREITLITCTKGAIKRIIVKAIEIYD